MKKIYLTIMLVVAMISFTPVFSQTNSTEEKEIKALRSQYFDGWNSRDLNKVMDCFGKAEGLNIAGGQTYTLDSLKVIWPRDYWNKRRDEKFWLDNLIVISETKNSAVAQITYSGRYTYIPTEVTWDYNKSAFMTCLIRKQNGKWKIVASHWSAYGKQIPKSKN